MKILEGPEYLMTTLMRFHYDRKQNRKTKVFTDINYELELSLPVFCEKEKGKSSMILTCYKHDYIYMFVWAGGNNYC